MIRFKPPTDPKMFEAIKRGIKVFEAPNEPGVFETCDVWQDHSVKRDSATPADLIALFQGTVLEIRHDGFEKSPEPDAELKPYAPEMEDGFEVVDSELKAPVAKKKSRK